MKTILAAIVGFILIVAVGIGIWQFQRYWNYTWGYETQVRGTICEMVKPEYLKDPSKC